MDEKRNIKDISQPVVKRDIKDKFETKRPLVLKAEKLTSALYLITNFLLDSDPIKWQLRDRAINLLLLLAGSAHLQSESSRSISLTSESALSYIDELLALVEVVLFERRASQMNFNLLREEYLLFRARLNQAGLDLPAVLRSSDSSSAWPRRVAAPQKAPPAARKSVKAGPDQALGLPRRPSGGKTSRRELIIELLKTGDSFSIKDVASALPGVSSKTVQRELSDLVQAGQLKKVGERRWSRYSLPR